MVTVDLPVLGIRDRDLRTQYTLPDGVLAPSAARGAVFNVLEIGELIDPSLTWVDIERLVEAVSSRSS